MKIAHNYYAYIVQCSDKSYYTGVTNNLERRLWECQEKRKRIVCVRLGRIKKTC